jgi:hypothetical protein
VSKLSKLKTERSFKFKSLTILLLVTIPSLAIAFLISGRIEHQRVLRGLADQQRVVAERYAALAGKSWNDPSPATLEFLASTLAQHPEVQRVRILDQSGHPVAAAGELAGDSETQDVTVLIQDPLGRVSAGTSVGGTAVVGSLVITFSQAQPLLQEVETDLVFDLFVLSLVVLAMVSGTLLINRQIVGRPLTALLNAIHGSAQGQVHPRGTSARACVPRACVPRACVPRALVPRACVPRPPAFVPCPQAAVPRPQAAAHVVEVEDFEVLLA